MKQWDMAENGAARTGADGKVHCFAMVFSIFSCTTKESVRKGEMIVV